MLKRFTKISVSGSQKAVAIRPYRHKKVWHKKSNRHFWRHWSVTKRVWLPPRKEALKFQRYVKSMIRPAVYKCGGGAVCAKLQTANCRHIVYIISPAAKVLTRRLRRNHKVILLQGAYYKKTTSFKRRVLLLGHSSSTCLLLFRKRLIQRRNKLQIKQVIYCALNSIKRRRKTVRPSVRWSLDRHRPVAVLTKAQHYRTPAVRKGEAFTRHTPRRPAKSQRIWGCRNHSENWYARWKLPLSLRLRRAYNWHVKYGQLIRTHRKSARIGLTQHKWLSPYACRRFTTHYCINPNKNRVIAQRRKRNLNFQKAKQRCVQRQTYLCKERRGLQKQLLSQSCARLQKIYKEQHKLYLGKQSRAQLNYAATIRDNLVKPKKQRQLADTALSRALDMTQAGHEALITLASTTHRNRIRLSKKRVLPVIKSRPTPQRALSGKWEGILPGCPKQYDWRRRPLTRYIGRPLYHRDVRRARYTGTQATQKLRTVAYAALRSAVVRPTQYMHQVILQSALTLDPRHLFWMNKQKLHLNNKYRRQFQQLTVKTLQHQFYARRSQLRRAAHRIVSRFKKRRGSRRNSYILAILHRIRQGRPLGHSRFSAIHELWQEIKIPFFYTIVRKKLTWVMVLTTLIQCLSAAIRRRLTYLHRVWCTYLRNIWRAKYTNFQAPGLQFVEVNHISAAKASRIIRWDKRVRGLRVFQHCISLRMQRKLTKRRKFKAPRRYKKQTQLGADMSSRSVTGGFYCVTPHLVHRFGSMTSVYCRRNLLSRVPTTRCINFKVALPLLANLRVQSRHQKKQPMLPVRTPYSSQAVKKRPARGVKPHTALCYLRRLSRIALISPNKRLKILGFTNGANLKLQKAPGRYLLGYRPEVSGVNRNLRYGQYNKVTQTRILEKKSTRQPEFAGRVRAPMAYTLNRAVQHAQIIRNFKLVNLSTSRKTLSNILCNALRARATRKKVLLFRTNLRSRIPANLLPLKSWWLSERRRRKRRKLRKRHFERRRMLVSKEIEELTWWDRSRMRKQFPAVQVSLFKLRFGIQRSLWMPVRNYKFTVARTAVFRRAPTKRYIPRYRFYRTQRKTVQGHRARLFFGGFRPRRYMKKGPEKLIYAVRTALRNAVVTQRTKLAVKCRLRPWSWSVARPALFAGNRRLGSKAFVRTLRFGRSSVGILKQKRACAVKLSPIISPAFAIRAKPVRVYKNAVYPQCIPKVVSTVHKVRGSSHNLCRGARVIYNCIKQQRVVSKQIPTNRWSNVVQTPFTSFIRPYARKASLRLVTDICKRVAKLFQQTTIARTHKKLSRGRLRQKTFWGRPRLSFWNLRRFWGRRPLGIKQRQRVRRAIMRRKCRPDLLLRRNKLLHCQRNYGRVNPVAFGIPRFATFLFHRAFESREYIARAKLDVRLKRLEFQKAGYRKLNVIVAAFRPLLPKILSRFSPLRKVSRALAKATVRAAYWSLRFHTADRKGRLGLIRQRRRHKRLFRAFRKNIQKPVETQYFPAHREETLRKILAPLTQLRLPRNPIGERIWLHQIFPRFYDLWMENPKKYKDMYLKAIKIFRTHVCSQPPLNWETRNSHNTLGWRYEALWNSHGPAPRIDSLLLSSSSTQRAPIRYQRQEAAKVTEAVRLPSLR